MTKSQPNESNESENKAPKAAKVANGFRPNAGVVICGVDDLVLAFRRTGTDAWQFPQGGIDPGETPLAGMWRELGEETGLDETLVELFAQIPEWLGYEIPEEYRKAERLSRGQVQKWFFLRVRDGKIDAVEQTLDVLPPEEFDAWKWTTVGDLTGEVIAFRRPIYERLDQYLQSLAR